VVEKAFINFIGESYLVQKSFRNRKLTRWDSERELFTTTSYMQRPAHSSIEPTS